jgi:hypothetical protein
LGKKLDGREWLMNARREVHFCAHHYREERDMDADDDEQCVGAGLAFAGSGPIGGVSEHKTLLHAAFDNRMLHHYICSANDK